MPDTESSMLRPPRPGMRPWMLLLPMVAASILLHLHLVAGIPGFHHSTSPVSEAMDVGSIGYPNGAVADLPTPGAIRHAVSTAFSATLTLNEDAPARDGHVEPACGLIVMLAGVLVLLRTNIATNLPPARRQVRLTPWMQGLSDPISAHVLDVQCRLSLVGSTRI